MAIPPVSGSPPPGGGGSFQWGYFNMLAAQFWAAIEKQELELAKSIFKKIVAYIARTGALEVVAGTITRMENALAALEALLAEIGGGGAAAGGLGIPGLDIIICVAFVIWAFRASTQSAIAEGMPSTTYGPIQEQPHPIYTEEQWAQIEERPRWQPLIIGPAPGKTKTPPPLMQSQLQQINKDPKQGWRTLIVGPAPKTATIHAQNQSAARVMLEVIRERRKRPAHKR